MAIAVQKNGYNATCLRKFLNLNVMTRETTISRYFTKKSTLLFGYDSYY